MSREERCDDHHVCRNGGRCVENPDHIGMYKCECDSTEGIYAGLSCDHAATTFCNSDNVENPISFCTNGGVCLENWDETGPHAGCECPKGYEGDFCELIEGQSTPEDRVPANIVGRTPPSDDDTNDGKGAVIGGVLGALVGMALIVALFVVIKRRRNGEQHAVTSPKSIREADSAQLEADGDVLRSSLHAVQSRDSMYSRGSSRRAPLDTDVDMTEQVEFGDEGSYGHEVPY